MRILKTIALSTIFVLATASLALACDGKNAKNASASEHAGCSAKAEVSAAAATTASSCASKAAVKTAGASCKAGDAEAASWTQAIQVETVRMPSGALAVFYTGSCEKSTAMLQASAEEGISAFACPLAQGMAADESLTTEMAKTEHGVMILVTAKDEAALDKYEAQFAVATSTGDEAGEE